MLCYTLYAVALTDLMMV